MKVLHISDLHYAKDYQNRGGIYSNLLSKMTNPFAQLQELLTQTSNHYDVVVVTGDLAEDGTINEYQEIKTSLNQVFACPIIATPGNHDNLHNYIEGYDPLFKVLEYNDYVFIAFSSASLKNDHGLIEEETIDELDKTLSKYQDKKIILLTHHHLMQEQFVMPRATYSERFEEVINQHQIFMILTGHTHHAYKGTYLGIPYYASGSLSFVADKDDKGLLFYEYPSMTEYEIDNNQIIDKVIKYQGPIKELERM